MPIERALILPPPASTAQEFAYRNSAIAKFAGFVEASPPRHDAFGGAGKGFHQRLTIR
jgi:hypothetical protein